MTDCCAGFRPQCSELRDLAIIGCIPENCTFIVNHCNTSCHLEDPSGCYASDESVIKWTVWIVPGLLGVLSFIALVLWVAVILPQQLKAFRRSERALDIITVIDEDSSSSNSTDSQG
jgi:hypothetical protein